MSSVHHKYLPTTTEDEKLMLKTIGIDTIEDLYQDVPKEFLLGPDDKLDLVGPHSELEVARWVGALSKKNVTTDEKVCFLGAGAYDHYVPAVIKHLAGRGEFFTAYTPYQPEISQGTLQTIFEFQSMICELTGMDVTNASMYDGGTAAAEASFLVTNDTKRNSIIVSKTVHPAVREVMATYLGIRDIELIEIDIADGVTDIDKLKAALGDDTAGVLIQNPNFFGIIEDMTEVEKLTHANGSLLINYIDPLSVGILKNPRELGADIAIGDAQPLGTPLKYGGPYLGFFATTKKLMRKMPGRIVGQSIDLDNKRAFVLTLQAREQHIRRFKATSNICSNQGLVSLTTGMYLTTMGKEGIKEVAEQCVRKAHYAAKQVTKSGKFKLLFDKPFFKEFAVTSDLDASKVNAELFKKDILGGFELSRKYAGLEKALLIAVTEKRTKEEIDKLASVMEVI